MGISLFQHNQEAYEAVLFMLSEKGKAAIIHPTGTGKSFIGFKLDVIYDEHITEHTGKYIVFCSNIEHLKEMQGKIHKWFDRIDKAPHSYTAYSDDPTTDKAFAEFKGDSSDHLKLLFAKEYLSTLDKAKWSSCYVSPDGYKTGAWLRGQKRNAQRNGIDPRKREMLMAIGVEF